MVTVSASSREMVSCGSDMGAEPCVQAYSRYDLSPSGVVMSGVMV